jgi:hypothetical protein
VIRKNELLDDDVLDAPWTPHGIPRRGLVTSMVDRRDALKLENTLNSAAREAASWLTSS